MYYEHAHILVVRPGGIKRKSERAHKMLSGGEIVRL